MSRRWHRPALWSWLLLAAAVAAFVALGRWQLQRGAQKEQLLAAFAAAERAPPRPFATLKGSLSLSDTQLSPFDSSLPANTLSGPNQLTGTATGSATRRLGQFELTGTLTGERFIKGPTTLADLSTIDNSDQSFWMGQASLRTGLDFTDVAATHTQVAGLDHTSVLAAAELAFGLLAIAAAVVPGGSRGLMALLGLVGLGFGIVVLADSPSLHDTFGVHDGNGFLYVAFGIVLLLAAALPVYGTDRRTSHTMVR